MAWLFPGRSHGSLSEPLVSSHSSGAAPNSKQRIRASGYAFVKLMPRQDITLAF